MRIFPNINNKKFNQPLISYKDLEIINNFSKTLLTNLPLEDLLQKSIDNIVKQFNFLGGVLLLKDKNIIYAKTITSTVGAKRFLELIGYNLDNLKITINDNSENLIVQSLLHKEVKYSNSLIDFTKNVLHPNIASLAEKITRTKTSISLPIMLRGEAIGALFLAKSSIDKFEKELPLLEVLSNQLGIAITNASLYSELKNALEVVNEYRRVEKDMIDIMGHELRTPITVILASLEFIQKTQQRKEQRDENLEKYLSLALESTKKEAALIETLLSATKVDANKIQLNLEKINLNDIIEVAVNSQIPIAKKKNLEIHYTKPQEPLYVLVDKIRVSEIIDNLISNAIKYTSTGFINVYYKVTKVQVFISIQDTGIGIDKEEINYLGKKFFRAKQNSGEGMKRINGTGLGLYVVFNLIKSMGGDIKVESKIGKGSIFTFSLPLYS